MIPAQEYISRSVAQTEAIAADLAQQLSPGTCIALHGALGAGKTQFVRGLVRALGGNPRQVSSPTYVLLHVYQTPNMPVFHLDAYRVEGSDDFEAIGFSELLDQKGVVIVEWASRVASLLPANTINISLHATSPRKRVITLNR